MLLDLGFFVLATFQKSCGACSSPCCCTLTSWFSGLGNIICFSMEDHFVEFLWWFHFMIFIHFNKCRSLPPLLLMNRLLVSRQSSALSYLIRDLARWGAFLPVSSSSILSFSAISLICLLSVKRHLTFSLGAMQFIKQVELQYQHEYAGISTSIGLTANPIVNFSGVIGNNTVGLGTDLSFDTASRNFTKCNLGLSFTNADLIAALTLWALYSALEVHFPHFLPSWTYLALVIPWQIGLFSQSTLFFVWVALDYFFKRRLQIQNYQGKLIQKLFICYILQQNISLWCGIVVKHFLELGFY